MIKFSDFMPVDFPDKTKVKFNMNAGNTALRAWDYLLDDAPEWIAMNAHKRKQANNNLNHADYLLAFAQYYVGIEELDGYALRELVSAVYVDAPDKSSGKRVQHIHIRYDGLGFIPLNELMKKETA